MTNALTAVPAPNALGWIEPTREQIDLLKRTIARGTSDDEFRLFLEACKRRRFDPFSKLIYPVKRYDSQARAEIMALQSSIDSFRLVAERTNDYAGQVGPFWCGEDGVWKDVWLSKDAPAAARVGVWRTGFKEPLWGVALWSNYVQTTRQGEVTKFWRQMGPLMLAKCAESQALRRAFPEDLAGLYTSEEMMQAEHLEVDTTTGDMQVPRAQPPAKPAAPAQPTRTVDTTTAKSAPASAQQPAPARTGAADDLPAYHEDGTCTVFGVNLPPKVWQDWENWKRYKCIEKAGSKSALAKYTWEQAALGGGETSVPSVRGDREKGLRWCVETAHKDMAARKPVSLLFQRAAWALNLMLEDRELRENADERADGPMGGDEALRTVNPDADPYTDVPF